jgi:hypothetical protein
MVMETGMEGSEKHCFSCFNDYGTSESALNVRKIKYTVAE